MWIKSLLYNVVKIIEALLRIDLREQLNLDGDWFNLVALQRTPFLFFHNELLQALREMMWSWLSEGWA